MNIFQQVNLLSEDEITVAANLRKANNGKSWVCPKCGNGSNGGKGDGIKQKMRKGRLNWWCPRCEANMSNSDVIAESYGISDTAELAKKLEELFPQESKHFLSLRGEGIIEEGRDAAAKVSVGAQEPAGRKNYARMYAVCQRALPRFLAAQGGLWRGLTNDTLYEASVGYNCNYRNKKVMILPYDEGTFFWREVDGKAKGVNVGGKRRLYEAMSLKTGKGAINFLMEGELDALTVKQALSSFKERIGVAATGSISFTEMLIRELDSRCASGLERPRFILLGDNDNRGVEGAKKMVSALKVAGYPAISVFFAEEGMSKVDANQYLQENGTEALSRWLFNVVEERKAELDKVLLEIKKATAQTHGIVISSLSEYLTDDFDSELESVSLYSGRSTGFENLDDVQLFLPGVYVLGGSPGAGKTTFAWQLLSQLAEGDDLKGRSAEHCVYCSYEMSRLELASKSIAREMRRHRLANKDVGLCLSSADIRLGNGRGTGEFKLAKEKFVKTAKNLRVAELSNTTLSELLVLLRSEADSAKNLGLPLTVAIDYLQLIPVENAKATAKERVDEIMLALKTFQRETNATLIVISSLNRESNKYGGNALFSFKESGAIEYSADVTWHLLYEKPEGKETLPRQVELQCAKNRNGATYKVEFGYYADSDYFCPCSVESDTHVNSKNDIRKKKSNRY